MIVHKEKKKETEVLTISNITLCFNFIKKLQIFASARVLGNSILKNILKDLADPINLTVYV